MPEPRTPNRDRRTGHRKGSTQVTMALAAIDFPASRDDIIERVGDAEIEISQGHKMPLRDMVRELQDDTYRALTRVADAIDAKWAVYETQAREAPGTSGAEKD